MWALVSLWVLGLMKLLGAEGGDRAQTRLSQTPSQAGRLCTGNDVIGNRVMFLFPSHNNVCVSLIYTRYARGLANSVKWVVQPAHTVDLIAGEETVFEGRLFCEKQKCLRAPLPSPASSHLATSGTFLEIILLRSLEADPNRKSHPWSVWLWASILRSKVSVHFVPRHEAKLMM